MSNFINPHGGPWGLKDPFLHTELNSIVEQLLKAPNFDEGSSHAPTADLELSGSNGGGFLFADMFPMRGETDVTDGLIFDAGTSGFVRLTSTVSLDAFGAVTFKTGNATTHETGTTETWASGAALTVASGATWNLTGTGLVRGSLTIKNSGGPGSFFVETGCTFQVNANATVTIATNDWNWTANNKQTYLTGSEVAGTYASTATISETGAHTFASSTKPLLSPARTWNRRARLRAVTLDTNVPQAVETVSPTYAATSIYSRLGSSDPVYLYLDFDPPHGGIITAVAVRSVIGSNPGGTVTRATYELVRWDNGLDAAATSLSSTVNDGHATNGSDWNTVMTTSLSGISGSAVDRTHNYGLRIVAARAGGVALDMWFDVLVTGTIAELNGQ